VLADQASSGFDFQNDLRLYYEISAVIPDEMTVKENLKRNLSLDSEAGALQQDDHGILVYGFQESEPRLDMNRIKSSKNCAGRHSVEQAGHISKRFSA